MRSDRGTHPGGAVQCSAGAWLAEQRLARGWSVSDMARRLRDAASENRDNLPDRQNVQVMIRRWEKDGAGISERYRLHYCRAFGLKFEDFGKRVGTDTADPVPLPEPSDEGAKPVSIRAISIPPISIPPISVPAAPGGNMPYIVIVIVTGDNPQIVNSIAPKGDP